MIDNTKTDNKVLLGIVLSWFSDGKNCFIHCIFCVYLNKVASWK